MKYRVLYPVDRRYSAGEKLIFLAGPIRGSSEWQFEAIDYLKPRVNAHIASPRRPHVQTEIEAKRLGIQWRFYSPEEQSDWEIDTLLYAYKFGVAVFWFQREQEHLCDHCHAQTTRVEVGIMIGHAMAGHRGNLIIGIEDEFDGAPYIRHTMRRCVGITRFYRTLKDTLEAAVTKINAI